jgi:hypothetical protein
MPPNRSRSHSGQKIGYRAPSQGERDRLGIRRRLLRPMSYKRQRRDSEGRDGGKRGTRHAGAASRGTRNATAENTRREIKTEPLGMDWDEIGRDVLPSLGFSGGAAQAGKIGRCSSTGSADWTGLRDRAGQASKSQSARGLILGKLSR